MSHPAKHTFPESPSSLAMASSFWRSSPSPPMSSLRRGFWAQAIFMARSKVGTSFTGESRTAMPAITSPGSHFIPTLFRNSSLGTVWMGVLKSMPL